VIATAIQKVDGRIVTVEEYLADRAAFEQAVKASTEAVRPEALMRLTELGGDDV